MVGHVSRMPHERLPKQALLAKANGKRQAGVEWRTQGFKKNPRPRTDFSRTDPLEAKDWNARCQGPKTQFRKWFQKKKVTAQEPHIFCVILCDVKKMSSSQKSKFRLSFLWSFFCFNESKNSVVLEPKTSILEGL